MPSAPSGIDGIAPDDDDALGRAVAVPHRAAEAAGEFLDVAGRRLVADRQPERVVGVVGLLGRRQDVVEDLAGVGEHGRPEAADVGKRPRRREPAAGGDRDAGGERRCPPGEERARVEERQRRVDHVTGRRGRRSPRRVRRSAEPALRAAHRLGQPGRAGREDEEEEVVLVDRRRSGGDRGRPGPPA